MYFMMDEAATILQVNNFGAKQLGYSAGELVGRSVLDVFCESDREQVRKNAQSCFESLGRTMTWEARKIRKDGTMLWAGNRLRGSSEDQAGRDGGVRGCSGQIVPKPSTQEQKGSSRR